MEVVSVSAAIAGILGLNVRLCEAIALGHDIGHPPYGHFGERMISELGGRPFKHNVFGATVANVIERKGFGLRLTSDTVAGIIAHTRKGADLVSDGSAPMEYDVVAAADKIAYLTSDINDSVRSGRLSPDDRRISRLGGSQRARNLNCVQALVAESCEKGYVSFFSSEVACIFSDIKSWMHGNIYCSLGENESIQRRNYEIAHGLIRCSESFRDHDPCLILALLSDSEIDNLAARAKEGAAAFRGLSVMEILLDLQPGIDYADPYL
jgi:dGTPase